MENKETIVSYEKEKMQQVITILNSINISGCMQIQGMSMVFEILANPFKEEVNDAEK